MLKYFANIDYNSRSLKTEYRRLCKRYHPDLGGNKADFVALTKEYEFLKNHRFAAIVTAKDEKPPETVWAEVVTDPNIQSSVQVSQTYNDWDTVIVIRLPEQVFAHGFLLEMLCNQFGLTKKFSVKPGFIPQKVRVDLHGAFYTLNFKAK